jgi:transcriptional regulator with XRE-family HTH domain
MHGLRQLHKLEPETFTTEVLADKFRVSPEAVRRILKSKWEPPKERRDQLIAKEKEARAEASKLKKLNEISHARPYLPEDRKEDRPKNDRLSLV